MPERKEHYELKDYISDLKRISTEVAQILKEGNEILLSKAAKFYPGKLNHLLIKRNMKSASVIFPFVDLPLLQNREQNVDLLDLNAKKADIDQLKDVIRKIESELEELEQ